MQQVRIEQWMKDLVRQEIANWPSYGSKASVQSSIDDYSRLLARTRELEEVVERLQGENNKLLEEKRHLMDAVTQVQRSIRDDIDRAVRPLERRCQALEAGKTEAEAALSELRGKHAEVTAQHAELQDANKQLHLHLRQATEETAALETERDDLLECLDTERSARLAATHELQERLDSKEAAERRASTLEADKRHLENKLLSMADSMAKQQDQLRKEFENVQRMRAQVEARVNESATDSGAAALRRSLNFRGIGSFMGGFMRAQTALEPQASDGGEAALDDAALPTTLFPDAMLHRHQHSHGGGCNGVSFSQSGLHAATCGQDGVVRLWGAHDGHQATELRADAGRAASSVNGVCFADLCNGVLGACSDKAVRLWDIHTGRVRHTMTGHTGQVQGVAQQPFSAKVAASCGEDRSIRIWTLDNGYCQRCIPCASKPLGVAFTCDGQYIVSAHFDGSVRVFEPSTGNPVQHVERAHTAQCVAVVPAAVASKVVSVGRDNAVAVTDVNIGKVEKRLSHAQLLHVGHTRCTPAVAPDNSVVAVGATSGSVLMLNMADGTLHSQLHGHRAPVTAVAWNPRSEDYEVCAGSVDKGGDVVFWRSTSRT